MQSPRGDTQDDRNISKVEQMSEDKLLNGLHLSIIINIKIQQISNILVRFNQANQYGLPGTMLSKFSKKIIGVEKNIKPPIFNDNTGNHYILIFKGYEPHFRWFQNNHQKVTSNAKIYCYDRNIVDVALEMAARNVTKLSYISTRNYETVAACPKATYQPIQANLNSNPHKDGFLSAKDKDKQQNQSLKSINSHISKKALLLLANYEFIIENTCLDIHPLEAYQKLCGYLMVRKDQTILEKFEEFRFSNTTLFKSFLLLPLLQSVRQKYLVVDELKLGFLERKSSDQIPAAEVQQYLKNWMEISQLTVFSQIASSFSEKAKIQWVMSNNLGEEVTKKDILNEKYLRYSYAIMQ